MITAASLHPLRTPSRVDVVPDCDRILDGPKP